MIAHDDHQGDLVGGVLIEQFRCLFSDESVFGGGVDCGEFNESALSVAEKGREFNVVIDSEFILHECIET